MLFTPTETPIPACVEAQIVGADSVQRSEDLSDMPLSQLRRIGQSYELLDEYGRTVGIIRYPRQIPCLGQGERKLFIWRNG